MCSVEYITNKTYTSLPNKNCLLTTLVALSTIRNLKKVN